MFEDSLIESGGRLKTKRGVWTMLSFVLEAMLVGVLVLIPLLFTEALQDAVDDLFSGAATATTTSATSRGSHQDRETGANRYRQRPIAHANQDSRENSDDQGR